MTRKSAKTPGTGQHEQLLTTLQERFAANMHRHDGLEWDDLRQRLERSPDKLATLVEMERTGGEPDVIGRDAKTGEYIFVDCSADSPKGRRSVCYDREALDARKKHKPETSAMEMAASIGADILNEDEYRRLQDLDEFDAKTSSWLQTPPDIRSLGGAMFGDFRFGTVWIYHNGAESYYGGRGFRCMLRV